jgi:hypothetical protein
MNAPEARLVLVTRHQAALQETLRELQRARTKFPGTQHTYVALMEEVGELCQALIDHEFGKGAPTAVRAEAIQVACMAVRLATEGDDDYGFSRAPGAEPLERATERVLALTAKHIESLREIYPHPHRAIMRLNGAATHIAYLMDRHSGTAAKVDALETSGAHVAAWALRIATEGDAAFPYLAHVRAPEPGREDLVRLVGNCVRCHAPEGMRHAADCEWVGTVSSESTVASDTNADGSAKMV